MREKINEFKKLSWKIRSCKKCELWKTRTHALPGEGNIFSKLMIIAQAPGHTEDREGRMFVGPSGKKLNVLFEKAGISREKVFMTNLLKCVLPHNRKPRPEEIETCAPYLDREMDLVDPAIIATLGYFPARYVFKKFGIEDELDFPRVCGEVFSVGAKRTVPLGHPATLLYRGSLEGKMVENYRTLRRLLDSV